MHPATQEAFLEELDRIKQAGFFDSIVKPLQDLTRGGSLVGGVSGKGPSDAFKKWQAAQDALKAGKSAVPKSMPRPPLAPAMGH